MVGDGAAEAVVTGIALGINDHVTYRHRLAGQAARYVFGVGAMQVVDATRNQAYGAAFALTDTAAAGHVQAERLAQLQQCTPLWGPVHRRHARAGEADLALA